MVSLSDDDDEEEDELVLGNRSRRLGLEIQTHMYYLLIPTAATAVDGSFFGVKLENHLQLPSKHRACLKQRVRAGKRWGCLLWQRRGDSNGSITYVFKRPDFPMRERERIFWEI